jgi:pre-rRNA-processing protein IPI1
MSLSKQTEEVSEYVIRLLRGETGISYLDRALTPQAYAGLLPTIWFLLNTGVHESSTQVLLAVIGHSIKTSSNAALKPATIEFVARIVLVGFVFASNLKMLIPRTFKLDTDSQYNGYVRAGKRSDEAEKLEEWIGHLPKTLWELNTTHLSTTEVRTMICIMPSSLKDALRRLFCGFCYACFSANVVCCMVM